MKGTVVITIIFIGLLIWCAIDTVNYYKEHPITNEIENAEYGVIGDTVRDTIRDTIRYEYSY